MYKKRLERLIEEMQDTNTDCLLLNRKENVFYTSGYCCPIESLPVVLIIPRQREPILILAEHELEAAKQTSWIKDYRTYVYYSLDEQPSLDEQIAGLIISVFRDFNLPHKKVGIEGFYLPLSLYAKMKHELRILETREFGPILEDMRLIKTVNEIEAIRNAVGICDVGQEAVRKHLTDSASEIELFNKARMVMEAVAGTPLFIGADLVSGKRTEEGGGPPKNRKIRTGDLVLSDLFPIVNGYWGDTTRVFCVGRFNKKQKEIYKIIVEAMYRGIAILKPGLRVGDVDKEVRSYIENKGYGNYFPHHTGHGIGLTHLEAPLIIPDNDREFRTGMVLALEPGIYLPGRWGIKIEEDVLVTEKSAEVLSKQPLEV